MDDQEFSQPNDERLNMFTSVQFDPEVWEIVQKKFQQFENLHNELEDYQSRRRDLLKQLSSVNESIADLQQQLSALSGKEKVEQLLSNEKDAEEEAAIEPMPEDPPAEPAEAVHVEAAADEPDEPAVGLSPIDEETPDMPTEEAAAEDTAKEWPEVAVAKADEPADAETAEPDATAPYEPVVEPPADVPAGDENKPGDNVTFAQPAAEAAPPQPPAPVEPIVEAAKEEAPAPLEVQELQRLFDEADSARRQSDSALKLVQLYDGKAAVFFEAMCRSHKQNGLTDDEARNEAVKDVNTMIATAKSSQGKTQPAPQDDKKKSGGMRRLFNH